MSFFHSALFTLNSLNTKAFNVNLLFTSWLPELRCVQKKKNFINQNNLIPSPNLSMTVYEIYKIREIVRVSQLSPLSLQSPRPPPYLSDNIYAEGWVFIKFQQMIDSQDSFYVLL